LFHGVPPDVFFHYNTPGTLAQYAFPYFMRTRMRVKTRQKINIFSQKSPFSGKKKARKKTARTKPEKSW